MEIGRQIVTFNCMAYTSRDSTFVQASQSLGWFQLYIPMQSMGQFIGKRNVKEIFKEKKNQENQCNWSPLFIHLYLYFQEIRRTDKVPPWSLRPKDKKLWFHWPDPILENIQMIRDFHCFMFVERHLLVLAVSHLFHQSHICRADR